MMIASIADESWSTKLAGANAASDAGEWPLAIELWEELRAECSGDALPWRKVGEAYCQAGLLERADEILEKATQQFADDIWTAYQYAIVAQRMDDWPEALRRAEDLRKRFPGYAISHVLTGEALRELGRLDDADTAFAEAVERFPSDQWALHGYAQLAPYRQSWDEALRRWEALLAAFPDHVPALVGRAQALHELGRPQTASAVVDDILARDSENAPARALRWALDRDLHPEAAVVDEVRQRGIEAQLPERVANPEVFIEITSICNFACTYCVSPMKLREKKQMSIDTFRRVMEQVATITTNPVRLHIDGEPTNHPNFKEMALLVNSYGLPIWLATNGSRLDPSYLDIWMDPLISMSTLPEELAERHNKLNFVRYTDRIANYVAAWSRSQARQNLFFQIIHYAHEDAEVEAAYKLRKNAFLIEFSRRAGLYDTCVEENSVEDEVYRFRRTAHPGALHFVKQTVSGGGLYPVDGKFLERERATAGFCDAPWRQLVIHSNGTLGACCVDLSGGTSFAGADDVETTPLKQLWEAAPQIVAMRNNFLEGRVERDVCQRCLSQGQVAFQPTSR